jgi:hypothetical protein
MLVDYNFLEVNKMDSVVFLRYKKMHIFQF